MKNKLIMLLIILTINMGNVFAVDEPLSNLDGYMLSTLSKQRSEYKNS